MLFILSSLVLAGSGCDFCNEDYDEFCEIFPTDEICTSDTATACGFFFDEVGHCSTVFK
jgi:hypothetical protein